MALQPIYRRKGVADTGTTQGKTAGWADRSSRVDHCRPARRQGQAGRAQEGASRCRFPERSDFAYKGLLLLTFGF